MTNHRTRRGATTKQDRGDDRPRQSMHTTTTTTTTTIMTMTMITTTTITITHGHVHAPASFGRAPFAGGGHR